MDRFAKIAEEAWWSTPLERFYDMMGVEEPDPEPVTATLYGLDGKPVVCSICERFDQWQKEGGVWVCEHEPPTEVAGLFPIRYLDSIPDNEIMIVDL